MTPLERYWFEKTRDRGVLIRTVAVILAVAILVSAIFGYAWGRPGAEPYLIDDPSDEQVATFTLKEWQQLLGEKDLEFSDFLEEMPEFLRDMDGIRLGQARKDLEKKGFSGDEGQIAMEVFDSLAAEKIEPTPALKNLAGKEPPVRYAQQGLGLVLAEADEKYLAAQAYEKEGLFPEADEARKKAVAIYLELRRTSDVERLMGQPLYEKLIDHDIRMKMASEKGDWAGVWRHLIPAQYESVRLEVVLLALLSGMVWLTIFCRLLQLETLRSVSFVLCLAAFLLGVASTWPTVFAYTWMDEVWGFTEKNDLFSDLIFNIFGIGLTEESMKLLLFCPLIPILLRRDNQLEILLVAGCVGLGFAVEENVMYFEGFGANVAAGRFVTANFFHISATALCGLALCRAISDPSGHGEPFLKWFGGIVLIHGLYDALGSVPGLEDMGMFAMACYIFLCYLFFGQAHELRPQHRQIIGLNFIFLTGLSVLLAVSMVDLSSLYGFRQGMSLIVMDFTGVSIVSYLFIREFSKG